MKQKVDKETGRVLEEGEKMTLFIQGEDWQRVKNILFKKLANVSSFSAEELGRMTDEQAGKELKVREKVVQVVIDWIDQMEGIPGQHKANLNAFEQGRTDDIILRLETPAEE